MAAHQHHDLEPPFRILFLVITDEVKAYGDVTNDDRIEVLDGVSEGDVIITAGVRRLEEGRRVRLVEAAESQP